MPDQLRCNGEHGFPVAIIRGRANSDGFRVTFVQLTLAL